mmetsp:Transcript_2524/g.7583  ORF Transcript_2524/g.7583 Transcript_2524/m.7583 type:complete len:152 (+) Transcript_2524:60-515(+)
MNIRFAIVAALAALLPPRGAAGGKRGKGGGERPDVLQGPEFTKMEGNDLADHMFKSMDKDGDGSLSVEEVTAMASIMTKQGGTDAFDGDKDPGPKLFKTMDIDGDGKVSRDEAGTLVNMAEKQFQGAKKAKKAKREAKRGKGNKGGARLEL